MTEVRRMAGEGSDDPAGDDRQEFRVAMLLTPAEYSRLVIESILNNVSPGELLRAAYFDEDRDGLGGD